MSSNEDAAMLGSHAVAFDDQVAVSRERAGLDELTKPSPALFGRRCSWSMAKARKQKTAKGLEIPVPTKGDFDANLG